MTANTALIVGVAIAILHFVLGPYLMDISLRFLYKVKWVQHDNIPDYLASFIEKVCSDRGIKFPRIGIIYDGAPNAFTYGHHPNNARIVLTQGLLDLLDEKEVLAVVAHEFGHVIHWDMLVMTLAQLVPLVTYYIYRTLARGKSKGRNKSAPYRLIIAALAYILYIISEYIVLWFSRIREFYADRFSGNVTGDPNSLASALVKIGYGLAGNDSQKKESSMLKRHDKLSAIGALGIFDQKTANILAISGYVPSQRMGSAFDKGKLKNVMKWDMWNPWAIFYEINSTHPLIAKRLKYLSNQSAAMGQEPFVNFDEKKPESYWDEFLVDLTVKVLPFITLIAGGVFMFLRQDNMSYGVCALAVGLAFLINIKFRYPNSSFPDCTISSLLENVKVSAVRPVPCKVAGKIIGRGVPGLIFSEDFVIQDETGIIFLDYRQPLQIINFFFGLLRAAKYVNQDATIIGWYRRSPIPYIEIKNLMVEGRKSTCFVYYLKLILALALIGAGVYFLLPLIEPIF